MYAELVKVLTGHFSPKQLEIVQRSKFYNCSRQPGKNISSYLAKLCDTVTSEEH